MVAVPIKQKAVTLQKKLDIIQKVEANPDATHVGMVTELWK
jgi:hypothetical protein